MNYFEKKELDTEKILEIVKDDLKNTLVDFKLKSIDYDLKDFSSYTDLECPCLKLATTGVELEDTGSIGSTKVHITMFLYVIYRKKSKSNIYKITDKLVSSFNKKVHKNEVDKITLSSKISVVNYANPLALKEHGVAEIELIISTTI